MNDPSDGSARALLGRIDAARASLIEELRSRDPASLATRPPSGEWSVVENVRHLIFAEQLHLGQFAAEGVTWSGVGLAPHFFANEALFAEVDTAPSNDIEEVLATWDAVHASIREATLTTSAGNPTDGQDRSGFKEVIEKYGGDAGEDLAGKLRNNLNHLRFHAGIIEKQLA